MYKIYEFWYSPTMQSCNGLAITSIDLSEREFRQSDDAVRKAGQTAFRCALDRDFVRHGGSNPPGDHQVTRGNFYVKGQECPAFHVKDQENPIVTFYVLEE